MNDGSEAPGRGRDDPLYEEGLGHLQTGELAKAMRCFEVLAGRYPDDPDVRRSLEQARFRAQIDRHTRVRPKRSSIRWSRVLVRSLIALLLIVLGVLIVLVLRTRIGPAFEIAQAARDLEQQVINGNRYLDAGDLTKARTSFEAVLKTAPGNEVAQAGLAEVQRQEKNADLCAEAEQLLAAGELVLARERFTDLLLVAKGSCNAAVQIEKINRQLTVEGLFDEAEKAYQAGDCPAAITSFRQLRQQNITYQSETVADRLYKCYVILGAAIVLQEPPAVDRLPEALDYYTRALEERPKDTAAQVEQQLLNLTLVGLQSYDEGRLDDAITRFSSIVNTRPDYLGDMIVNRLFDAYLRRGDQYRDVGDPGMAYRMYDLAAALPGVDPAPAVERRAAVVRLLTPTPTPTVTPTSTPLPTATPYIPPTPIPPPTPAPPLALLRGQIVFRADKEGFEGYWVMNPDGSKKRYLGASKTLDSEYQALRDREQLSPDGRFRVYATKDVSRGDRTVNIYVQGRDDAGNLITWQVTNFSKLCYDPVWAPDGSRIAFVSQERTSDDIWVIDPDGTNAWDYTLNQWEWDKHPSWSPDSSKMVFWSNREGTKQVYVIDADGRNLKKISGIAPWDEYDPLWIK